MPQVKFDESLFVTIAKKYEKIKDESHAYAGEISVKDIWDFYNSNRELFYDDVLAATGGKKKEITGIATFYNKKALSEHLKLINEGIKRWRITSIIENDEGIYSEFDWKEYMDNHINQKDYGMRQIGKIINLHREEVRALIDQNRNLQKQIDELEKENRSIKEQFREYVGKGTAEETSRIKLKEKNKKQQKTIEELKEKLKSGSEYLTEVEKEMLQIEENKHSGIDSVPSTGARNHSYLGEQDKKTPAFGTLVERAGGSQKDVDKYAELFWEDDDQ